MRKGHLRISRGMQNHHLSTLQTLLNRLKKKAFRVGYPKATGSVSTKRFDKRKKEGKPLKTARYKRIVREIKALIAVLRKFHLHF